MRFCIFALVSALFLSGCVADVAWQKPHQGWHVDEDLQSTIMTVELSDEGAFHQLRQKENMLEWLSRTREWPLIVYVHGWHHNAKDDDENLLSFIDFVKDIEMKSGTPIAGLYVGWRGDSVDVPGLPELIDFYTIWDRKRTSRTVGEVGLHEIVDHIRNTYPDRRVFAMGHSLGGSALFHALKSDLEGTFNDNSEYLLLNPAASDEEFREFDARLSAMMQAEISTLSVTPDEYGMLRDYRKIIVFQALGDRAVGFFYRIAFLGSTPVGFKEERITHRASICDQEPQCKDTERDCVIYLAKDRFAIESVGDTTEECREGLREPLWVISGEDSVARDHNDIFNGVQGDAVASLVAQQFGLTLTQ